MEMWRPIPTHTGYYEVSNRGRVRSLGREVWVAASSQAPNGYFRKIKSRVLASCPSGERGVHRVSLWKNHELTIESIHILVLEAFIGPRPSGLYGCHSDDLVSNNVLNNLYWGTPKQNSADKMANGNQPLGEECTASKLTLDDVLAIRAMAGSRSQERIGEMFGVRQSAISRIINRKHWRHIT